MKVVALTGDLMDRSKLTAAIEGVTFARDVEECAGAEVVIVDLARHTGVIAELRAVAPTARIVGFGPHVQPEAADQARVAGADVVLPRSRFFRDPATAIAAPPD